jgi:hypothetical protein
MVGVPAWIRIDRHADMRQLLCKSIFLQTRGSHGGHYEESDARLCNSYRCADVSEERTASIFRVEEYVKEAASTVSCAWMNRRGHCPG